MRRKIILNSKDLMTVITECVTIPKLKGKLWGGRENMKHMIAEGIMTDINGDYKKAIRESDKAQSVAEELSSYNIATDSFITEKTK